MKAFGVLGLNVLPGALDVLLWAWIKKMKMALFGTTDVRSKLQIMTKMKSKHTFYCFCGQL